MFVIYRSLTMNFLPFYQLVGTWTISLQEEIGLNFTNAIHKIFLELSNRKISFTEEKLVCGVRQSMT